MTGTIETPGARNFGIIPLPGGVSHTDLLCGVTHQPGAPGDMNTPLMGEIPMP